MRERIHRHALFVAAVAVTLLAMPVAAARAQSYSDVTAAHWASGSIGWVTDQGPAGAKLLDDYNNLFKPERGITRAQLARALVIACGHEGETVTPRDIPDMPQGAHPYYWDVQIALKYGLMGLTTREGEKGFYPDVAMKAYGVENAMVRWLKQTYSTYDWSLLSKLKSGTWEPTAGFKPKVPSYFAAAIAARQLQLRYNHPSDGDAHEVRPTQVIDRAEVAYMFRRAFKLASSYELYGLAKYAAVTFPALSARQREVVNYACKYIGYPYVWAGEWPTKASPYGRQAAGGFDCSGFTFYVMQCHFGYAVTGRGAGDQARLAKPRITRGKLKCGDLIFFGYDGTSSKVASIYHAAIYLGRGWFIHSTGSSDGVTVATLNDNGYWQSHFAWGRRLLKPAELVVE